MLAATRPKFNPKMYIQYDTVCCVCLENFIDEKKPIQPLLTIFSCCRIMLHENCAKSVFKLKKCPNCREPLETTNKQRSIPENYVKHQ